MNTVQIYTSCTHTWMTLLSIYLLFLHTRVSQKLLTVAPSTIDRYHMASRLHFVRLKNMHIFDQLRIEELLFRSSNEAWCLLNMGPQLPTVVTGLSGKVPELVNIDAAKRFGYSYSYILSLTYSKEMVCR